MKSVNYLKCKFMSLSSNESLARSIASSFIIQLNPTITEVADVKCAVSEAVTNCIVHGYRGCVGEITMILTSYSDRSMKIDIRDKGCGIADIEQAREPLFTTSPESERSGMGISVMESFTDKLTVKSKPGHGTNVTMIKKLAPIYRT